jgi:hypothetical protein
LKPIKFRSHRLNPQATTKSRQRFAAVMGALYTGTRKKIVR